MLIKFQVVGENEMVRIFVLYTPHQVLLGSSVKDEIGRTCGGE
jgi:hypothetical protein